MSHDAILRAGAVVAAALVALGTWLAIASLTGRARWWR